MFYDPFGSNTFNVQNLVKKNKFNIKVKITDNSYVKKMVPFSQPILGGLKPGKKITINAVHKDDAKRSFKMIFFNVQLNLNFIKKFKIYH